MSIFAFARDDLGKMEYTTMCIKEAMRIHNPVPGISRRLTEPLTVEGTQIPTGMCNLHVCVCVWLGGWVCVCVVGWLGVCLCVSVRMYVCVSAWLSAYMHVKHDIVFLSS